MVRGSGYGAGVNERLKDLERSISVFNGEATLCGAERLGEVHINGIETLAIAKELQSGVEDVKTGQAEIPRPQRSPH